MAFLTQESDWDIIAKEIEKRGLCGLDSEFEGVTFDPKKIEDGKLYKTSCVNKADIIVFSVAVLSTNLSPRGYTKALGAVLPVEALKHSAIRSVLENPSIIKVAHNSNVDIHAFFNAGIDVVGVVNSQSLARWMLPGRMKYNLDDLGIDILGYGKTESFEDMFVVPRMIQVERVKKTTVNECSCGIPKCRLKKTRYGPDGEAQEHTKVKVTTEHSEVVDRQDGWDILSQKPYVSPEHPMHGRYIAYAQRDAVVALELYDWFRRQKTETEVPWYDKAAT